MVAESRPLTIRRMHSAQWSKSMLMLARGAEAVLAKAARWVPEKRPDLRGLVNRRYARQLRKLVQRELSAGESSQALTRLRRAAALCPWDLRTYPLMIRAAISDWRRSASPSGSTSRG